MYKVNVFFENKADIHKDKIKSIDFKERKAILEKAFSTFYGRDVKVDYVK